MMGLAQWVDEVMEPFLLGIQRQSKGVAEERAIKVLLGLMRDLRSAAEKGDWEIYAVVRVAPPVGGDQSRSLCLILAAKPEGWKVVDMNDIRAEETPKSKLDRLLDRK